MCGSAPQHAAGGGSSAGADGANEARDVFLANISHELRTPLNGLLGMTDLLKGTALTAEQHGMLEAIRDSGETLSSMLSDILDQADLVRGQIILRSEGFVLGEAVRTALCQAKDAAARKGIAFEMRIEPSAEYAVVGDATRLKRVVASLADNAVKFTDKGAVYVSACIGKDSVCRIEISDTGAGIHPAMQADIFGCFRQGDSSGARSHGGLGLGLALARQLANLMGGGVECRSAPGEGSAFVLTLPIVAAAPLIPSLPQECRKLGGPAVPVSGAVELSVLVVDDHPVNRELLKLALAPSGARVVTAENGAEACELWTTDRFDLVVMDLQMPVMDGLTAIRRIRAVEASRGTDRTPVVVFTANATNEQEQASFRAGADHFLTKPLVPSALMGAFHAILQSSRPDWTEAWVVAP